MTQGVTIPDAPMSVYDVRAALTMHWPPSEYMHIDEAPDTANRQGRKLDRLVLSLWESRNFEREGIEIKVSMSDWQRELKNAAKADWWWRHVHRFWVAVPAPLAVKIIPELPTGWGLLACSRTGCKAAVKAAPHEAEPLPWGSVLGLMRSASAAGFTAMNHASRLGYEKGLSEGKASASKVSAMVGDGQWRKAYEDLQEQVRQFEASSGIAIQHNFRLDRTGKAVALVHDLVNRGFATEDRIRNTADELLRHSQQITALANQIAALMKAQPEVAVVPDPAASPVINSIEGRLT